MNIKYAHLGKGRSIHADGQMEWFNYKVDDRSKVVGGAQRNETPDGYVFPLSIESGLVYMHSILVPTDDDLQQYPHVFFTSPGICNRKISMIFPLVSCCSCVNNPSRS